MLLPRDVLEGFGGGLRGHSTSAPVLQLFGVLRVQLHIAQRLGHSLCAHAAMLLGIIVRLAHNTQDTTGRAAPLSWPRQDGTAMNAQMPAALQGVVPSGRRTANTALLRQVLGKARAGDKS